MRRVDCTACGVKVEEASALTDVLPVMLVNNPPADWHPS
jgi:hypothetical protein